jgi:N6-L-threonylcarbamoyladenine synthase
MIVLGIETSCDDTAAAVVRDGREILSSVVRSQDAVHAEFGGVVPELASRNHVANVVPVVREALALAGLGLDGLHGVAATRGPGLIGSLLVGLEFAKALSRTRSLPLAEVHHLDGHLSAVQLGSEPVPHPHVGLVVSGGHSSLFEVLAPGRYLQLGATRDDAAGEAFDKAAKMLGLGYPGGRRIAELAQGGDPRAVAFPRALASAETLDYSFSGLKAAFRRHLEERGVPEPGSAALRDLAASFQEAVVDALLQKAQLALEQTGHRTLVLAGGVAANRRLRQVARQRLWDAGLEVMLPAIELCTDNAAMIAAAGDRKLTDGEWAGPEAEASARLPL